MVLPIAIGRQFLRAWERIYYLLKDRGLTIKGAKSKIKDNKGNVTDNAEIVDRLQKIRSMLIEVKGHL
jgi:hypothetical protein